MFLDHHPGWAALLFAGLAMLLLWLARNTLKAVPLGWFFFCAGFAALNVLIWINGRTPT